MCVCVYAFVRVRVFAGVCACAAMSCTCTDGKICQHKNARVRKHIIRHAPTRTSVSRCQDTKPNSIIVRHWSIGQRLTLMCSIFMYMIAVNPSTKSTARIRGAATGYVVRMYPQTSSSQHTLRNGWLDFVCFFFWW